MNVHKRTRLNLLDRREIWRLLYQTGLWKVTLLAEHFRVSRPGIYPRDSTQRLKTLQYGLQRLVKVEQTIQ